MPARNGAETLGAGPGTRAAIPEVVASPDKTLLGFSALAAAGHDPNLGRVLAGRYRLLRELGAGQMARVYVAEQIEMGRNVAIKLMLDEVELDEVAIHRFRREMRVAASLSSPHTITYFDAGQTEGGTPFLAMELLVGETLRQRLERDARLSAREVIEIAHQIGESVQEAHDVGVVHRDLKPENIFLCRRPNPQRPFAKVLDFGLAKLLHPEPGALQLTDKCTTVGTPAYMAPEQIVAERLVDHRADLYALAVICFELLTGRLPFVGATPMEVAVAHVAHPIPRAVDIAPGLPACLDAFFRVALAKRADDRFDQATAVAEALECALG